MQILLKTLFLFLFSAILAASPHLHACQAKNQAVNSTSDAPVLPTADHEGSDSESTPQSDTEENEQVSESKKAEDISGSLISLKLYFSNNLLNFHHIWNGHNSKHRPNKLFKPPINS